MSYTVKVSTFPVPNLDFYNEESIAQMEEDIEDNIKNKLNDGYVLAQVVGGDAYIMLIFTKGA